MSRRRLLYLPRASERSDPHRGIEKTTDEEFKKAASSNFIFLDFYNYISFEMLADYYGVEVSTDISDISNVKHILFNLYDSENLYIYAKNNKSGNSYNIKLSANLKEINSLCDEILKNKTLVIPAIGAQNTLPLISTFPIFTIITNDILPLN